MGPAPVCAERYGGIMHSDSSQKVHRQSAALGSYRVQALLPHSSNTTNGCKQTSWSRSRSHCSTQTVLFTAFRITLIIQMKENLRNVRLQINFSSTSLTFSCGPAHVHLLVAGYGRDWSLSLPHLVVSAAGMLCFSGKYRFTSRKQPLLISTGRSHTLRCLKCVCVSVPHNE